MDQGANASNATPGVVPSSRDALSPEVAAAVADPRRRLGRYALVRELGRGGMGVVWRAYDTVLHRHVALKTFLERPREEELRRFAVEVNATARLQHPNIVGILDVGEHDGRAWYAMELIDGESFEAQLRGAPPSPVRIAEVIRDVARALAHAHERGIVHRDVKPDNILIDREGRVRLADLGLARDGAASQQLTKTGQMLGTPAYMAPEQAGGEGSIGPACDLYALGGVLYRALAGRPPFSAPSVFGLVKQVLFDAPAPIGTLHPGAPPELDRLAMQCLAKAPAQRPPSAAAVVEALERFLASNGAGPARARRKRAPRGTTWTRTVPIVGASLLVVLALAAASRRTDEAPVATGEPGLPEITPTPQPPSSAPAEVAEVADVVAPTAQLLASLRARWDFAGPDPWHDRVTRNLARGEGVRLQSDGLAFSGSGDGLVLSPTVIGDLPAGAIALTLRRDGPDRCRVLAFADPGVVCTLGLSIDPEGHPTLSVGSSLLTSEVVIGPGRFHRLVFAWGPRGCRIVIDGAEAARSAEPARVAHAPNLELGRDPNNPRRTGSHMTIGVLEVHDADLDDEALRGL